MLSIICNGSWSHIFVLVKSKSSTKTKDTFKIYFKEVIVPPTVICVAAIKKIQGCELIVFNEYGFQIYNI